MTVAKLHLVAFLLRDRRLRCLCSHKGSAQNDSRNIAYFQFGPKTSLSLGYQAVLVNQDQEKNFRRNIKRVLEPVGRLPRAMANSAIVAAVLALTLVDQTWDELR